MPPIAQPIGYDEQGNPIYESAVEQTYAPVEPGMYSPSTAPAPAPAPAPAAAAPAPAPAVQADEYAPYADPSQQPVPPPTNVSPIVSAPGNTYQAAPAPEPASSPLPTVSPSSSGDMYAPGAPWMPPSGQSVGRGGPQNQPTFGRPSEATPSTFRPTPTLPASRPAPSTVNSGGGTGLGNLGLDRYRIQDPVEKTLDEDAATLPPPTPLLNAVTASTDTGLAPRYERSMRAQRAKQLQQQGDFTEGYQAVKGLGLPDEVAQAVGGASSLFQELPWDVVPIGGVSKPAGRLAADVAKGTGVADRVAGAVKGVLGRGGKAAEEAAPIVRDVVEEAAPVVDDAARAGGTRTGPPMPRTTRGTAPGAGTPAPVVDAAEVARQKQVAEYVNLGIDPDIAEVMVGGTKGTRLSTPPKTPPSTSGTVKKVAPQNQTPPPTPGGAGVPTTQGTAVKTVKRLGELTEAEQAALSPDDFEKSVVAEEKFRRITERANKLRPEKIVDDVGAATDLPEKKVWDTYTEAQKREAMAAHQKGSAAAQKTKQSEEALDAEFAALKKTAADDARRADRATTIGGEVTPQLEKVADAYMGSTGKSNAAKVAAAKKAAASFPGLDLNKLAVQGPGPVRWGRRAGVAGGLTLGGLGTATAIRKYQIDNPSAAGGQPPGGGQGPRTPEQLDALVSGRDTLVRENVPSVGGVYAPTNPALSGLDQLDIRKGSVANIPRSTREMNDPASSYAPPDWTFNPQRIPENAGNFVNALATGDTRGVQERGRDVEQRVQAAQYPVQPAPLPAPPPQQAAAGSSDPAMDIVRNLTSGGGIDFTQLPEWLTRAGDKLEEPITVANVPGVPKGGEFDLDQVGQGFRDLVGWDGGSGGFADTKTPQTPAAGPAPNAIAATRNQDDTHRTRGAALEGMTSTELEAAIAEGDAGMVQYDQFPGIVFAAGDNATPIGYITKDANGQDVFTGRGTDVASLADFWAEAAAQGLKVPPAYQANAPTGAAGPAPVAAGAPVGSGAPLVTNIDGTTVPVVPGSNAPAPAPVDTYTGGSSGGYTSGGGGRGGYSSGGGGGYSGGGNGYSKGGSGSDMSEMFGSEMSMEDFLEDYDGDGKISGSDRMEAMKRFQAARKKRKGKKGATRSSSNVPSRPDSPMRSQILATIDASKNKKKK